MTDSSLLACVEEYLSFRRGLGFDLGCAIRHLCLSPSACSRLPASVSIGPFWSSCPAMRCKHCWMHPTGAPGADSGMLRCLPCCTTQAHASPRSFACVSPASFWTAPMPCTCTGKAGRSVSSRCGRARSLSCAPGLNASTASPRHPCSPIAPANPCHVPVSSTVSA